MKKITFYLLLFSNIALAQTSRLYNSERRLLVDSSYQIDEFSFNNIKNVEKVLLPKMYNSIKYSAVARENDFEGTVIVQLSISANAQNYSIKIVNPNTEELNKAVLDFFNTLSDNVKAQLSPTKGTLMVYIPVKFEILKDNYDKLLNKNHTITIQYSPSPPEKYTVQ